MTLFNYSSGEIERLGDERLAAEIDSLDFAIDALQCRIDELNTRLVPLTDEQDRREAAAGQAIAECLGISIAKVGERDGKPIYVVAMPDETDEQSPPTTA
jgi:hypothetical protein